MGTRFQCNVEGTFAEKGGVLDRGDGVHLGVWFTVFAVIPFANDLVAVDYDRSYHGIGAGVTLALPGQLKRSLHVDRLYVHFFYLCFGDTPVV